MPLSGATENSRAAGNSPEENRTWRNPEEALVREIAEELDASISVDRLITYVHHDYDTFHLDMRCFLCTLDDNSITLLEHEAANGSMPPV